jgi:uncharacterized protein (DUF1330 family)
MLKNALLVTVGIVIGATAIQLHAAAIEPSVYEVYEANITDEAAYAKALPDIQKIVKEAGGATRIAGGFNKAKLTYGKADVGNRYVIVRWDSLQSYEKAWNGGGKAWIEKNAPDARQVIVEGIEAK